MYIHSICTTRSCTMYNVIQLIMLQYDVHVIQLITNLYKLYTLHDNLYYNVQCIFWWVSGQWSWSHTHTNVPCLRLIASIHTIMYMYILIGSSLFSTLHVQDWYSLQIVVQFSSVQFGSVSLFAVQFTLYSVIVFMQSSSVHVV